MSMQIKDETGHRYGNVVVVGMEEERRHGKALWLYQCDCGNAGLATGTSLRQGEIRSCGCRRAEFVSNSRSMPGNQAGFNAVLRSYKRGASTRELEWDLTQEEFRDLTQSPCYYCGCEPGQERTGHGKSAEPFIYNGIDRIDGSAGYFPDNVVSCCWRCNEAKMNVPADEFFDWVDRIWEYQHNG